MRSFKLVILFMLSCAITAIVGVLIFDVAEIEFQLASFLYGVAAVLAGRVFGWLFYHD